MIEPIRVIIVFPLTKTMDVSGVALHLHKHVSDGITPPYEISHDAVRQFK
jgi:hypothetical protein